MSHRKNLSFADQTAAHLAEQLEDARNLASATPQATESKLLELNLSMLLEDARRLQHRIKSLAYCFPK